MKLLEGCISPLHSCIKSIFLQGKKAVDREKILSTTSYQRQTPLFSPSQLCTRLSLRPPSGVCKLCPVLEPRLHSSVPYHQIFGCHENLEFLKPGYLEIPNHLLWDLFLFIHIVSQFLPLPTSFARFVRF